VPRRLIALPLLSSALYVLSFPNFNLSFFAWIALVPLILSLRFSVLSPRQAFLHGWFSGTLAYSGILYWIIPTFQAAHLSMVLAGFCLLLLAGYLGLYWGAWSWFIQRHSSPWAGAAAWVALEYLRTYLFSGFPWALLADSQVKILPLIQIASITGVYGLSFLVVLVNLAIAQWRLRPALLSLGLVALTCFYGNHCLNAYTQEPKTPDIHIALLQGNIDQYEKWDQVYVDDIEKTFEQLITESVKTKPDMIVWPETSVPGYLLQDPPLREWLLKTIKQSHTNHLVGVPVIHDENAYNSSFSINRDGVIEGEYAKQHLVPFGETVPWSTVLGRFIKVLNDLGGFTAGKGSPVLSLAGYPVGVNICYEAIFPNLVRQSVEQGAVLIANLTNDGWYMRTAAPYQHFSPNIYRAVENDRWLVRADNTGISAIIDPVGQVVAASSIYETTVITGTVHPRSELTLYTRSGDFFAWICVIFCLMIFFRDILREPRQRESALSRSLPQ
jgi:apolipoprotein N-acyltransferase